ncbi:MAG: orotate phosphoribosyltransferase [Oscillibacter sp.]|nr:orotate phosphoribosyltransferase [Oscillibacter sp.]
MEPKFFKLPVCVGDVTLSVARGHFTTSHSHINYFIDVTRQKASLNEATAVAQQLASRGLSSTMVDTILCLDGTSTIGACLARQLTQSGFRSINEGRDVNIMWAEVDGNSKIIFRENARGMIEGKNVLILMASLTTGKTAARSMESIRYYGGCVAGIASIYSSLKETEGVRVTSLFDVSDLPDYADYAPHECPLCKAGVPLDAIVNAYGYSVLEK